MGFFRCGETTCTPMSIRGVEPQCSQACSGLFQDPYLNSRKVLQPFRLRSATDRGWQWECKVHISW